MRSNTKNLRPILGSIFCAVFLIVPAVGELSPAAAFGGFGGGFGRMGGFGPRTGIHPAPRRPMMPQRRASGVDRPPRTNGGSLGNDGDRGPGHHGIIGRGRGGVPYGGDGGGNYAGGGGAGGTNTFSATPSAVPEPMSIIFFGTVLVGVTVFLRKRLFGRSS